jgi:hypothetical protein
MMMMMMMMNTRKRMIPSSLPRSLLSPSRPVTSSLGDCRELTGKTQHSYAVRRLDHDPRLLISCETDKPMQLVLAIATTLRMVTTRRRVVVGSFFLVMFFRRSFLLLLGEGDFALKGCLW